MRMIILFAIATALFFALRDGSGPPPVEDTLAVRIPVAVAMGADQGAGQNTDQSADQNADQPAENTQSETSRFEQAVGTRTFSFPADHAPHDGFRTEWWYIIGNLENASGDPFGFQFTLFRNGLAEQPPSMQPWQVPTFYMGHAAISDIAGDAFYATETFARSYGKQAGDRTNERTGETTMWLQNWSATWRDNAWHLVMAGRSHDGDTFSYSLRAEPVKNPVLRGEAGLSQKSAQPGNASWYYAQPRMETTGQLTVGGITHQVHGTSWLDREWSTSALGPQQIGWDWFALHLDDGRDLMVYVMRTEGGGVDATSHGGLTLADGQEIPLKLADMQLDPQEYWTSPVTGARYPIAWRVQVPTHDIDLQVRARLPQQEHRGIFSYWEGFDGDHRYGRKPTRSRLPRNDRLCG